jgi:Tol biopolymer transport system component
MMGPMHKLLLAILIVSLFGCLPRTVQPQGFSGAIIFGAWSDTNRDGVVLADTDTRSLYRLEIDVNNVTRITPITQQDAARPLVSPNGSVPFFVDSKGMLRNPTRIVSRETVIDSAYTLDGTRLIALTQPTGLPNRVLSVVTTRTSVLTQFTGANVDDTSISLSPDGSRVLFTQVIFGINRLYVLDLRTGAIALLTDGTFHVSSPRWSPNGSTIAYVRQIDTNRNGYDAGDPRSLWAADSNGVNQRRVSPEEAVDAGAPIWSADSFHIAFLNRTDNDADKRISAPDALQLAVSDLSTGIVNVVAAGFEFSAVLWNPNGTRLAFRGITSDTNGDGFITNVDAPVVWVMRTSEAVATPLSSSNQAASGALGWSPDGSRLAYAIATHDDNVDGKINAQDATQLYVVSVDSALARPDRPVLDGSRIGALAWSPDGKALGLVVQTGSSLGTLARLDIATSTLTPLTDNSLLVDATMGLRWVVQSYQG